MVSIYDSVPRRALTTFTVWFNTLHRTQQKALLPTHKPTGSYLKLLTPRGIAPGPVTTLTIITSISNTPLLMPPIRTSGEIRQTIVTVKKNYKRQNIGPRSRPPSVNLTPTEANSVTQSSVTVSQKTRYKLTCKKRCGRVSCLLKKRQLDTTKNSGMSI